MIVFSLSRDRYRDRLRWAPILGLGTISYSFYALHPLGLAVAQGLYPLLASLGIETWMLVMLIFAISASASVLIALPMVYLVEQPGIVIGRTISAVVTRYRRKIA